MNNPFGRKTCGRRSVVRKEFPNPVVNRYIIIKRNWLLIAGLILCISLPVFSGNGARPFHLPTETIDRPLVLPAHMWQVYVPACVDFYGGWPGDHFYWTGLLYPLFPSIPRHSITDKFEFINFPLPFFRYALRQYTDITDETVRLNGLALTIEGGLNTISYTQLNGVGYSGQLLFNSKCKLATKVWTENSVALSTDITRDAVTLAASITPSLGFQVSPKLALRIRYTPAMLLLPDFNFRHSAEFRMYLNPNPYIGIELGVYGFQRLSYWHIEPMAAVVFQW